MQMEINCPYCGTRYEVTEQECGRKALCEVCNNKFMIAALQRPMATAVHALSQEDTDTKKVPRSVLGRRAVMPVINYAGNMEYFSVTNKQAEAQRQRNQCGCVIVGIGIFVSSFLAASTHPAVLVIGLIITAGICALLMCNLQKYPCTSDAEIDAQAMTTGDGLENIALSKLGIDRDEVALMNPVHFWGYRFVWPSVLGDTADNIAVWIRGKDGRHRSAEVTHSIFFFG